MAISIRNEDLVQLVRRLAAATGQSVDEALAEAVRVQLATVEGERQVGRNVDVSDLQARIAALPVRDPRPGDEILYDDEFGLPK